MPCWAWGVLGAFGTLGMLTLVFFFVALFVDGEEERSRYD